MSRIRGTALDPSIQADGFTHGSVLGVRSGINEAANGKGLFCTIFTN